MKEATGELNMTVITVVAIAAVAAFFYAVIWPNIKVSVVNNQCEAECGAGQFKEATRDTVDDFTCSCSTKGNGRNSTRK